MPRRSFKDTTEVTYTTLFGHINQAFSLGWINNSEYKNLLEKIAGNSAKLSERDKPAAVDALLNVFHIELKNGLHASKINDDGFNLLKEDVARLIR